jgi:Na+-transporting NADH:ubiquinone oxidoreductase subunit NqrC
MSSELATSQTALVVIAIAVSLQSLLLIAGAWVAMRAWNDARAQVDRHLTLLQARADVLTEAACRAADTFEEGASRVSTLFHQGERVAGLVASAVGGPKAMLLAGVVSKLMSRRRPRAGKAA